MNNSIRNIGILAHVDAGKTTLTEAILLAAGAIRRAGRVDEGTAHTDTLSVERARGISVTSSAVCVRWMGCDVRIIDTPGHADFCAEVEQALLALDGCVLVLSAVEGVQAQTAVLYRTLRSMGVPTIAFINKTDRQGADVSAALEGLAALGARPLLMSGDSGRVLDELCRLDEELLALALEGEAPQEALHAAAARQTACGALTPALAGAALRGQGVTELLDGVCRWLPPPKEVPVLSVVVYALARQGEERQARVRVFGGSVGFGQDVLGGKVKRVRKLTPGGQESAQALHPGDIGVLVGGAGLQVGAWIGEPTRGRPQLGVPVMRSQVIPQKAADLPALQAALTRMAEEWPALRPRFEPSTREVYVQVMGQIQQEVVQQTLAEQGVAVTLAPPSVLYRETPAGVGVGQLDMFIPPWYARATFRVSPLPRGQGVQFVTRVSTDYLFLKYQRDIEETARQWLGEGLSGWPVTDALVELTDGACISIKKPGSRFGPVVPLGLCDALRDAGCRMLEPVQSFEIIADGRCAGAVLHDLQLMRAQHEPPVSLGEGFSVRGTVPVATSLHYAARLAAVTSGRGIFRVAPAGYREAPEGAAQPLPRTTPDPLDKAVFMKHLRGTLE